MGFRGSVRVQVCKNFIFRVRFGFGFTNTPWFGFKFGFGFGFKNLAYFGFRFGSVWIRNFDIFVRAFKLTIKMAAQKARFTEDFRLI